MAGLEGPEARSGSVPFNNENQVVKKKSVAHTRGVRPTRYEGGPSRPIPVLLEEMVQSGSVFDRLVFILKEKAPTTSVFRRLGLQPMKITILGPS